MTFEKKQTRTLDTNTPNGGRAIITVDFGMIYIKGNSLPYFSVTGEVRKLKADGTPYRGERGVLKSGAIVNEVRQHFNRELARATRWHLCGQHGQPMHYIANAVYWRDMLLGKYEMRAWDPDPIEAFASHIVLGARDSERWLDDLSPAERREEIKQLMVGQTQAELEEWLEMRSSELQTAFVSDMRAIGVEFITPAEMAYENAKVANTYHC